MSPKTRKQQARTDKQANPSRKRKRLPSGSYVPKTTYHALLVIDPGTLNIKVAYAILKIVDNVVTPIHLTDLVALKWSDDELFLPSQMAYKESESSAIQEYGPDPTRMGHTFTAMVSDHPEAIFGRQVDVALAKGEIQESYILRHLKPVLFEGSAERERVRGDHLTRKMRTLGVEPDPQRIRMHLAGAGQHKNPPWVEVEVDHFAQLLRWVCGKSLRRISVMHPELDWPDLSDADRVSAFLASKPHLSIGLPVPAKSTVEDKERIVAAATKAGIRSPGLISEPTAGLTHHVLEETQDDGSVKDRKYLVLDDGAGSVDIAALSVKRVESGLGSPSSKFWRNYQVPPSGVEVLRSILPPPT